MAPFGLAVRYHKFISTWFCVFFFIGLQTLVHAVPPLGVSGATVSGTGRKIAEPHGQFTSPQIAAASLFQAVPT